MLIRHVPRMKIIAKVLGALLLSWVILLALTRKITDLDQCNLVYRNEYLGMLQQELFSHRPGDKPYPRFGARVF